MKLSASQVKSHREDTLRNQQGRCVLCCEQVTDDAVLDHDHKTGHIRGVLHRGCNSMLGVIENNRPRYLLGGSRLFTMLSRVEAYMKADHTGKPLHPTHRTAEQKRVRTNLRAKKARAAKKVINDPT
jgi:hypothetical protein